MNNRRYVSKSIHYGDRVFARISQNGKTIYNFVSETVGSVTEIMMKLRELIKGVTGLVMVHLRNYSQGWGDERPLMLYEKVKRNAYLNFNFSDELQDIDHKNPNRMLFPWETH